MAYHPKDAYNILNKGAQLIAHEQQPISRSAIEGQRYVERMIRKGLNNKSEQETAVWKRWLIDI